MPTTTAPLAVLDLPAPALEARSLVPSMDRCVRTLAVALGVIDVVFVAFLCAAYVQISSLPTWDAARLAALVNGIVIVLWALALSAVVISLRRTVRDAGRSEAALVRASAALRRFPLYTNCLEVARWLTGFGLVFALEHPPAWQPPALFLITMTCGPLAMGYPLIDWCISPATAELWRAMHQRGLATRMRPVSLASRLSFHCAAVVITTSAYFACFAFSARIQGLSMDAMMRSLAIFSCSALWFTFMCAVLLSRTFTRPVREMSEIISQIAADTRLAHVDRVPIHRGDEIGALALLTNTMIERLEQTATERANALRSLGALNQTLERRVDERTRQLSELQDLAVASAHHAGMSEIATNVLHNVGNVLTSVNVSCDHLESMFAASRVPMLGKVTELLRKNAGGLADYLTTDPAGKRLPDYLTQVGELLVTEHGTAQGELAKLRSKIELINDVVSAQQQYARGNFLVERADIGKVVDDILNLQAASLRKHNIQVVRTSAAVASIAIQRTKLAHVLVNLIKNAGEAMAQTPSDHRILTVEVGGGDRPFIRVTDSGEGIPSELIGRIFQHGFTTKLTGHGFGLHACANAMTEMGGAIAAASDGIGRGATFTLSFTS